MSKPHNSSLSIQWFVGTDSENKKSIEEAIRNSTIVREQLVKIIEGKLRNLDHDSVHDYEMPSWPYYQADSNGQARVLKEFLTLLTFDQKGN